MKVLIAEDDNVSRHLVDLITSKLGYERFLAKDGLEALDLYEKHMPNIAILDWMMPEMEGIELCKYIRENYKRNYTYIILATSKDTQSDIELAYSSGADDYMTKPILSTHLINKLKAAERILKYEQKLAETQEKLIAYAEEMEALAEVRANQLIQADKMATLGVLSAGIAHEINNPATYISGNIQTLEVLWDRTKSDISQLRTTNPMIDFLLDEYPAIIKGIKKGVSSISKIVSGLKAYCHQATGDKNYFDVQEAIEEALEICKNALKYNVRITKNIPENIPELFGDKQQIEQVLVNLFVNSVDAMENLEQGDLFINVLFNDYYVNISVEDSGPGVRMDIMDKIFDPFFTTKEIGKGTGLGMSISKGIIDEHFGDISIINTNKGAKVDIRLPICVKQNECIIKKIKGDNNDKGQITHC